MRMLESSPDIQLRLFTASIFRLQYNMGGRIDDVSKALTENLCSNKDIEHNDLSLATKLPWSKNVSEYRQAPFQILVGASNAHYCVLLGLALWLEWMIMNGLDDSEFVYAYKGTDDPKAIKRDASNGTKKILKDPEFDVIRDDKKGTHSMRKFSATQAQKIMMHKDHVGHCFC